MLFIAKLEQRHSGSIWMVAWMLLLSSAYVIVSAPLAAADEATIRIANFTFDPPVLTVKAESTVKWVNGDDTIHLVAEKDGKFRSPALDTDDSFTQRFDAPGTVEYFCIMHPQMTGKIVVEP